MHAFIRVILISVLSIGTNAHLCLLSPRQRGTMGGLNAAPASDCFLTTGPCGDRPMGPVQAYIRAGRNHTVVFQKNYSHFMASSPGTLEVNLGVDSADGIGMVENLASWPDMDDDPLTLYTVDVWASDACSFIRQPSSQFILLALRHSFFVMFYLQP